MATKLLGAGVSGNLTTDPLYNFGLDDDVIIVEAGSGDHTISLVSQGDPLGLAIATGAGNDLIDTSLADANSWQFAFAGSGSDTMLGGAGSDWFVEGTGDDKGSLGGGSDYAFADAGNDYMDGGDGVDTAVFTVINADGPPQEAQTYLGGVTFDLAQTSAQNLGAFGLDTYLNFENVEGGDGGDRFLGSSGANRMEGGRGNDRLYGRAGNDHLFGEQGSDILQGGSGADILNVGDISTTAAFRDIIRFTSVTDSGLTTSTRDRIVSFDRGGQARDDKIDLSAIDANPLVFGNQAFQFIGNASAFTPTAGGQVRLQVSGSDTIVHVDTDFDAFSEMTFTIAGVTGLRASDFVL